MTFWHISALKISWFQTAPPASATVAFGGTGAGEILPLGTGSPLPFLSKVLEVFSCSQSNANTRWRLITETPRSTTKAPRGGGLSEDRQPWLCGENQWGREASHHLSLLTPGQPASHWKQGLLWTRGREGQELEGSAQALPSGFRRTQGEVASHRCQS